MIQKRGLLAATDVAGVTVRALITTQKEKCQGRLIVILFKYCCSLLFCKLITAQTWRTAVGQQALRQEPRTDLGQIKRSDEGSIHLVKSSELLSFQCHVSF